MTRLVVITAEHQDASRLTTIYVNLRHCVVEKATMNEHFDKNLCQKGTRSSLDHDASFARQLCDIYTAVTSTSCVNLQCLSLEQERKRTERVDFMWKKCIKRITFTICITLKGYVYARLFLQFTRSASIPIGCIPS